MSGGDTLARMEAVADELNVALPRLEEAVATVTELYTGVSDPQTIERLSKLPEALEAAAKRSNRISFFAHFKLLIGLVIITTIASAAGVYYYLEQDMRAHYSVMATNTDANYQVMADAMDEGVVRSVVKKEDAYYITLDKKPLDFYRTEDGHYLVKAAR